MIARSSTFVCGPARITLRGAAALGVIALAVLLAAPAAGAALPQRPPGLAERPESYTRGAPETPAERAAALAALERDSRALARAARRKASDRCARCTLGDRLLHQGASGKDVWQLQFRLRKLRYRPPLDSRYRASTVASAKKFQARWGLDADGIIGPLTVGALNRALRGERPPTSGGGVAGIPSRLVSVYRSAAARYGHDWRLLAAMGWLESDHGRSTLPGVQSGINAAGCCAGMMQFCIVSSCGNAWRTYGLDGDGDGRVSVYDPDDAITTAGRYVRVLKQIVGTNTRNVLAAYNAGPGNVQRYNGVPPFPETQSYVSRGTSYIAGLPR